MRPFGIMLYPNTKGGIPSLEQNQSVTPQSKPKTKNELRNKINQLGSPLLIYEQRSTDNRDSTKTG